MSLPPDTLAAMVASRTKIADGVVQLELTSADGQPLPAFEPGAHIDIYLADGLIRQYSLANFQPAPDSYTIAVGLAETSRGGSKQIHETVSTGSILRISLPRNSFPIDPDASGYVFVAGGIGITPILSMARWCAMNRKQWRLLYAVRSRKRAAYVEELAALGGDRVRLHVDDETGQAADLAAWLGKLRAGEHVYCCGPEPLMNAVEAATAPHPATCIHFERFSSPEPLTAPASHPFTVKLRLSARELTVAADASILDTLEQAGIDHPFGCREGLCRSCEAGVCAGIPDHRDYVLSDTEKASNQTIMVCVSRAKNDCLELNL